MCIKYPQAHGETVSGALAMRKRIFFTVASQEIVMEFIILYVYIVC